MPSKFSGTISAKLTAARTKLASDLPVLSVFLTAWYGGSLWRKRWAACCEFLLPALGSCVRLLLEIPNLSNLSKQPPLRKVFLVIRDTAKALKTSRWMYDICVCIWMQRSLVDTSVLSPAFVSYWCSSLVTLSLWSLLIKMHHWGQLTTWDFSSERQKYQWILLSRGNGGLQMILKRQGDRNSYLMLDKWQLFKNAVFRQGKPSCKEEGLSEVAEWVRFFFQKNRSLTISLAFGERMADERVTSKADRSCSTSVAEGSVKCQCSPLLYPAWGSWHTG